MAGESGGVVDRAPGRSTAVGRPVGSRSGPLPTDTEQRLAEFTTLIGPAIANAESRAQLAASRARLVAAADETRRRIERDLHDGVQQRLISANLALRRSPALREGVARRGAGTVRQVSPSATTRRIARYPAP
jgi:signal transduction histidine kinase